MNLSFEGIKQGFDDWIGSVAGAIAQARETLATPRAAALDARSDGAFLVSDEGDPALLALAAGEFVGATGESAGARLRGARVAVRLPAHDFVFRELTFPAQAVEFLDGVLRAHIDRITPWTSAQAAFGHSAPAPVGADRIRLTLAATPRARVEPIVAALAAAQAHSVVLLAQPPEGDEQDPPIVVLERAFDRDRTQSEARRGLTAGFVGAMLFASLAVLAAGVGQAYFESLSGDVARQTRAWRQAQMAGAHDPALLLHRQKLETPLAVLVMNELASILPDDTYLKGMQISEGKIEIDGVSADATRLVGLLEKSPTFSRATFSAPTTHAREEPGDHFHIQAQLAARYRQGG